MSRVVIYPYKMGSASSKLLRNALRERDVASIRVYPDRNYTPRADDLIINWGNSIVPNWNRARLNRGLSVLNPFENISNASNKLTAFNTFLDEDVPCPMHTADQALAREWFTEQQVELVYCRTLLQGKAGAGIVLARSPEEVVSARMYTEGLTAPKRQEFRVHVFDGRVIDVAEKRRMGSERREEEGIELVNEEVRSYENGWVYARSDLFLDKNSSDVAETAVNALGLDFGAVDLCVINSGGKNKHRYDAYVFEVNTAPGFTEGSTALTAYLDAILRRLDNDGGE